MDGVSANAVVKKDSTSTSTDITKDPRYADIQAIVGAYVGDSKRKNEAESITRFIVENRIPDANYGFMLSMICDLKPKIWKFETLAEALKTACRASMSFEGTKSELSAEYGVAAVKSAALTAEPNCAEFLKGTERLKGAICALNAAIRDGKSREDLDVVLEKWYPVSGNED